MLSSSSPSICPRPSQVPFNASLNAESVPLTSAFAERNIVVNVLLFVLIDWGRGGIFTEVPGRDKKSAKCRANNQRRATISAGGNEGDGVEEGWDVGVRARMGWWTNHVQAEQRQQTKTTFRHGHKRKAPLSHVTQHRRGRPTGRRWAELKVVGRHKLQEWMPVNGRPASIVGNEREFWSTTE